MKYKYTVKVKGKDVPEFRDGLGKGVLSEQIVEFPEITEENERDGMSITSVYAHGEKMRDDVIEINIEKIID